MRLSGPRMTRVGELSLTLSQPEAFDPYQDSIGRFSTEAAPERFAGNVPGAFLQKLFTMSVLLDTADAGIVGRSE